MPLRTLVNKIGLPFQIGDRLPEEGTRCHPHSTVNIVVRKHLCMLYPTLKCV